VSGARVNSGNGLPPTGDDKSSDFTLICLPQSRKDGPNGPRGLGKSFQAVELVVPLSHWRCQRSVSTPRIPVRRTKRHPGDFTDASQMKLSILAATAALLMTTAAQAGPDGCGIVSSPDRLLAVRTGPGANHPAIFQLRSGQTIYIDNLSDGASNKWRHVNAILTDGKGSTAEVEGCAYGRYLRPTTCAEGGC
jgi:hypothetical protein